MTYIGQVYRYSPDVAFYIYFLTNISTEYCKHDRRTLCFSLQNAVYFIMLLFWFLYYSHFTYRVC